jgi:hypothetical protein
MTTVRGARVENEIQRHGVIKTSLDGKCAATGSELDFLSRRCAGSQQHRKKK